jgi:hypothetical protein
VSRPTSKYLRWKQVRVSYTIIQSNDSYASLSVKIGSKLLYLPPTGRENDHGAGLFCTMSTSCVWALPLEPSFVSSIGSCVFKFRWALSPETLRLLDRSSLGRADFSEAASLSRDRFWCRADWVAGIVTDKSTSNQFLKI